MRISHEWLSSYFPNGAPRQEEVADLLNFHAFEVESIEEVDGDQVYDVKVLPNRAHDCLSHWGVARELSAISGLPTIPFPHPEFTSQGSRNVTVVVDEVKNCPRYTARFMEGVTVAPSPEWLSQRLGRIGQKSINNLVDAANYVMFSMGQPLHVFDADKVEGSIHVRFARDGEKITTLDNKEVVLDGTILIIADDLSPLAIAGIKGGKKAEATDKTKNIILESANFNGTLIRKTSQKLAIRTDASTRFEHGISPMQAPRGLDILSQLILEIANPDGAVRIGPMTDMGAKLPQPYKIGLTAREVHNHLGSKMSQEDILKILDRLGFTHESVRPRDRMAELAPMFVDRPYKYGSSTTYDAPEQFDCSSLVQHLFRQSGIFAPRISVDLRAYAREITQEELLPGDLAFFRETTENGVRYETLEYLPKTAVPEGVSHVAVWLGDGMVIHATGRSEINKVVIEPYTQMAVRYRTAGFGRIIEDNDPRIVVTVPFERLDLWPVHGFLSGGSPIDLIEEIGRIAGYGKLTGTIPSLVSAPAVNKIYYYAEMLRGKLASAGFSETINYSFADNGEIELENPLAGQKSHLRTDLATQMVERLLFNKRNADLLGQAAIRIFEIGHVYKSFGERIHLALASSAKDELETLLEYKAQNLYKGDKNVVEYDLEELVAALPDASSYANLPPIHPNEYVYTVFSPYPFVSRDIAVWVPSDVSADEVRALIVRHAGAHHRPEVLRLVDRFEKEGKVSYAFRLVFLSNERTLTGEEIAGAMEAITDAMSACDGWKVR